MCCLYKYRLYYSMKDAIRQLVDGILLSFMTVKSTQAWHKQRFITKHQCCVLAKIPSQAEFSCIIDHTNNCWFTKQHCKTNVDFSSASRRNRNDSRCHFYLVSMLCVETTNDRCWMNFGYNAERCDQSKRS